MLGSALGSLVGGIFGSRSASRDRAIQAASIDQAYKFHADQQERYDMAYHDARANRNDDYARSLTAPADIMKNVMDLAGQSGIHPLAALGVQSSYSPASSSSPGIPSSSPGSVSPVGDGGTSAYLGDAIGEVAKMFSKEEKEKQERAKKFEEAQINRLEAETRELDAATSRTQIQTMRRIGSDGGGNPPDSPVVDPQPNYVLQTQILPDGSKRNIPVGPDADEVLTGTVLYVYDKVADAWVPKKGQKPTKKVPNRRPQPKIERVPAKPNHRKPIKR